MLGALGRLVLPGILLACGNTSSEHVPLVECTSSVGWLRHPIYSGGIGADGVTLGDFNRDGWIDVASPIEQSARITVSLNPTGRGCNEWSTVKVAKVYGPEDALAADIDGDGWLDVVSASEEGAVAVHFSPANEDDLLSKDAWTTVSIDAATGLQRWMQLAHADIDGDGHPDLVGGGRVHPAMLAWFSAPTPRDGTSWVLHPISPVGWTMSLVPYDVDHDGDRDVVVSDRSWVLTDDQSRAYDLMGSRWVENLGGGQSWENHTIARPDSGGAFKFLEAGDFDGDGATDVIDGSSHPGAVNRTTLRTTDDALTWTGTPIPDPASVGEYHDVEPADIDGDGRTDLVLAYSGATDGKSGVVWLRHTPDGWERGEISGPEGTKFDNVMVADVDQDGDLDVVTSEQIDMLGVVWYENPTL